MRQVRSVVVPERRILLKGSSPRTTPDTLRDARRFRLVLATDSSYLVDCIYCNRGGDVIKNSEGFRILNEETELLSVVGVQVQWYHVPRDFNGEADALANAALRG
ncbi:G1/S-specific cyclin CCN1 [Fusarium oxysporum f. sp. albedinis]|nr:G1/S-specific cyclin CCN1 [Fusarium oxysporum f. sp. albedinis]